jgi:putative flippase GtrA
MDTSSKFWFLVRYGAVGVVGGVIQTSTLYVWVGVLHLEADYLAGAVVGFCAALLVTFTLQKYWTFRDHGRTEVQRQFILYSGIALFSLGLNILLLHLSKLLLERAGLNFFDTWYLLAQIAVITLLAGMSFIANYFLTFRKNYPAASDT